jgi:hypothetical protein
MKLNYTLILCLLLAMGTNCHKDDDANPVTGNSCEEASKKFETAVNEYVADMANKEKCKAYVAAVREYLDKCGRGFTQAQRDQYNHELDAVNCAN